MNFRTYLLLFLSGLILPIICAQFQSKPGYLDSEYYYAGGIQLATGKGFNEPYLWNYLDGTKSLPHPSHTYWFPLASIVSAIPMWLLNNTSYAVARIPFIIIAALVVPITAHLAYLFSKRKDMAIISAVFAIFSVYHAPFVGVTDNFSLFMFFGGLYFIVVTKLLQFPSPDSGREVIGEGTTPFSSGRRVGGEGKHYFILGILAGLLSLSRSDGLLWLGITFLFILFNAKKILQSSKSPISNLQLPITNLLISLLGFLLIMSPWYYRNLTTFGTLMAPGGSRALWLQNYDQTFIYPPEALTKESFLEYGWENIWNDRLWAINNNLQSAFAAHGGIILFPFIIAGIIYFRKDIRVKLAVIAWLILFFVMTFLFPFAGVRGAFFHAGAAFQPMWWVLAPLGLDSILASLRKRNWGDERGRIIFTSSLVLVTIILTFFVAYIRIFQLGWGEGETNYVAVEQFLVKNGSETEDVVIVWDAPLYYLDTGRSAVSIPYGGTDAILAVSKQFNAEYLILEPAATLSSLKNLLESPNENPNFIFLGEVHGANIFKINP
ncbi:MAG: hypothetical protein JNJ43_02735 [Anaerolineales bacterium]|nr:hypothetical protein [Anaerolineales bacterium]